MADLLFKLLPVSWPNSYSLFLCAHIFLTIDPWDNLLRLRRGLKCTSQLQEAKNCFLGSPGVLDSESWTLHWISATLPRKSWELGRKMGKIKCLGFILQAVTLEVEFCSIFPGSCKLFLSKLSQSYVVDLSCPTIPDIQLWLKIVINRIIAVK